MSLLNVEKDSQEQCKKSLPQMDVTAKCVSK